MKRVLIIAPYGIGAKSGTGERTSSLIGAVSSVAEPHVMQLSPRETKPGTHVCASYTFVKLYDPVRNIKLHRRKRQLLHREYTVDGRIYRELETLHAKYRFDAFICRYFQMAVSGCDRLGPSLLDFDNLPPRMPGLPLPAWHHVTWQLMLRRLAHFSTVFVTKPADSIRLTHPNVRVLPCTSTQIPESISIGQEAQEPTMLFVGSCWWNPNRNGLQRFIDAVLPHIRQRLPAAKLRVVGEDSESFRAPGVDAAGFVEQLDTEYRRASIVVCPIYEGLGATVKLSEAVGFAKPVVTTPHAARGFEGILEPDRDLCVAASDNDMADMCVRLLTDHDARTQLGARARVQAESALSQAAIDRIVGDALAAAWR